MKKTKIWVGVAVFAVISLGLWQSAAAENDKKVNAKAGNLVKVSSCVQLGTDIQITRDDISPTTILKAGCSDAGYGKRNYTFACVGENKYKVEWEACPLLPRISHLQVRNSANGILMGSANSSYLTIGNKFAAKQQITVAPKVAALNLKLLTKNTVGDVSYTYAFVWMAASSTTNFDQALAKSLATNANFSGTATANLNLTDYYRNQKVTVLAFMRNNDGVSKVPGMPVEVDDVVAIHLNVLPLPPVKVCNNLNGGDGTYTLCLGKSFTYSMNNLALTYSAEYRNHAGLTVNGTQFVFGEGQSVSVLGDDKKTVINVRVQDVNHAEDTVKIRFRVQPMVPAIQ